MTDLQVHAESKNGGKAERGNDDKGRLLCKTVIDGNAGHLNDRMCQWNKRILRRLNNTKTRMRDSFRLAPSLST